ncbi:MAG: hypothetical protein ACRDRH_01770 [Pseudonocardia sp.]
MRRSTRRPDPDVINGGGSPRHADHTDDDPSSTRPPPSHLPVPATVPLSGAVLTRNDPPIVTATPTVG